MTGGRIRRDGRPSAEYAILLLAAKEIENTGNVELASQLRAQAEQVEDQHLANVKALAEIQAKERAMAKSKPPEEVSTAVQLEAWNKLWRLLLADPEKGIAKALAMKVIEVQE